jgi:hypothetical protein
MSGQKGEVMTKSPAEYQAEIDDLRLRLEEESGANRGLALNQILRISIGRGALGMKS